MPAPRTPRIATVALLDVLRSDEPLPSAFVGDAIFVVPSGREVRLAFDCFEFASSHQLYHTRARTWARARKLFRSGRTLMDIHVRYPSGAGAFFPVDSLSMPVSYLSRPAVGLGDLPGILARQQFAHCAGGVYNSADVLSVSGLGDSQVALVSSFDYDEPSISNDAVFVLDRAEQAELAEKVATAQAALQALQDWWAGRRTLATVLPEVRARLAST